ncbi:MAG: hypothetical protein QM767_09105 [Anaeromyxobacter sp.]
MPWSRVLALLALLPLASCFEAQPCPSPLEACGGVCYDLASEPLHCGSCGRSCAAGNACFNGSCIPNPEAACRSRTGGAFITLVSCGQSMKLWAIDQAFIARAQELAADPASPGASVPDLRLLFGPDCDDQWSWRASFVGPAFVPVGSPTCDRCPSAIELEAALYVQDVGEWCPSSARVAAVDLRPSPAARTSGE